MLVNILLTDGFDEELVVRLARLLRRHQFRVSLIALSIQSVRGRFGIKMIPDKTLTDAMACREPAHLIIPDAFIDAPGLISDPRTHRWMMSVASRQGQVALMPLGAAIMERLFQHHLPQHKFVCFTAAAADKLILQLNHNEFRHNMQPMLLNRT